MSRITIVFIIFSLNFLYSYSSPTSLRGVSPAEKRFYEGGTEFTCRLTGAKIPFNQVNDDYCDCSDGSDEPGTSACSNGQFFCRNKFYESKFIPSSNVNDGICDCCDGSDEYLTSVCQNTCREIATQSIAQKQEELRVYKLGVDNRARMIQTGSQGFQAKQDTLSSTEKEVQEQQAVVDKLKTLKEELEEAEREEIIQLELAKPKPEETEQPVEEVPAPENIELNPEDFAGLDDELKEEDLDLDDEDIRNIEDDDDDPKPEPEVNTEEMTEIQKKAKEARDELKKAQQELTPKETKLEQIKKTLEYDFGPNKEYFNLLDKCFQLKTPEYTYEMCPYGGAKQSGTSLGSFSGWKDGHKAMHFTEGASCWGGPRRSVTVEMVCGHENQILDVHEPSKCTYEMKFATPAACDPQHLMVLELNLQEYFSESIDE